MLVRSITGGGPMPPVGLAYIAAAVRAAGHPVQVIDGLGDGLDTTEEFDSPVGALRRIGMSPTAMIDAIEPGTNVIGVSHLFLNDWPVVLEIVEAARRRFPDALIIVGGENASAFWPWMFEQTDAIDVVVKGEGEATITELLARVADGSAIADLQGTVHRSRTTGEITDNGLPTRIRDLASIPRPAWDLFPIENYFDAGNYFGVDRGLAMPMLATRGCPYKCSFCSSPQMWTTRYTVRDPEDIVDEIQFYVERYGIKNVDFVDLTAMTKRQWTLDFCDALERRGLDITWQLPVGTRSEGIDDEVLRRLSASGCRNITFAPETGSQHMLEVYDKRLDLDHLLEDVRHAHRHGLIVHLNMIIGHPDETWADRWANLRFMVRAAIAGASTSSAAMFHPYPGSRDFQRLYDEGRIQVDDHLYYDGLLKVSPQKRSWNLGMSSRQQYITQTLMILIGNGMCYLAHPRRILHTIAVLFGRAGEHTFLEVSLRTRRKGVLRVTRTAGGAASAPRVRPELHLQKNT